MSCIEITSILVFVVAKLKYHQFLSTAQLEDSSAHTSIINETGSNMSIEDAGSHDDDTDSRDGQECNTEAISFRLRANDLLAKGNDSCLREN
jgi:hypothetical protein